MTGVVLRPNESQDQLLKRFRKKVAQSGILSTVRRKRWFVSKSELRRIQRKKAIRRLKRRQRKIAAERGFAISEHALYLYADCTKPKCPHRRGGA